MPLTQLVSQNVTQQPALQAWYLPPGVRPPTGPHPLAGKTILLVEDSRHASDAMRLMCQRLGARLRRAENLEQARAHLRTYRPDAVLVDLGLPDGRGEDLISDLASSALGPMVVALSGDDTARTRAMRAGAAGFLAKPVQSLAHFQDALLHQGLAAFDDEDGGEPDPMSLRDDLRYATRLLEGGGTDMTYAIGFVAGLARMSEDPELRALALAALPGAEPDAQHLDVLRQAVSDRLRRCKPF